MANWIITQSGSLVNIDNFDCITIDNANLVTAVKLTSDGEVIRPMVLKHFDTSEEAQEFAISIARNKPNVDLR